MDNLQNLQKGGSFKVKTGSSDGLSLRREATTKDGTKNIILSIPNGTKVTLESGQVQTSDKRTWYNVRYTDKDKKIVTGWVANDYLEDLRPLSVPTLSWSTLFDNHPGNKANPCDKKAFKDQCAIRMGVALEKSGVDLSSFQGERCWQKLDEKHDRRHILRAQELADWLTKQTILVGKVKTYKNVTFEDFSGKYGIVFLLNGTGWKGLDHIDVWDGAWLKNGDNQWFGKCEQVGFWDLRPCTIKTEEAYVNVYSGAKVDSSTVLVTANLNQPLEVAEVQENWVKVKIPDPDQRPSQIVDGKVFYKPGWIERKFVSGIPDQAVPA